jgi:hypothetical protein
MRSARFTRFARLAAAGAVITGLTLTATSAGAVDSTTGLQAIKDAAHTAITNRITDLNKAITSVNGTTFLATDKTALVTGMKNDITGLKALDTTIQADTTTTAAKTDAQKIFTDFRIYALVLPVTHLVVATDAITNVVMPKMTTVADALQLIITKTNATAEQPKLDDMKAQIAAAQTATNGVSADLQSFTPTQWNANHDLLTPDRAKLQTARMDLGKARSDAAAIVVALLKH